jgi:hypothetical protein
MLKRRDVLAAGLVLPMAGGAASAKSTLPNNPLIGSWSLIEAMTVQTDGRTGPWDGHARPYSGLIIYGADGVMAVQIATARAPMASDGDLNALTAEQQLAYFHSYYAYYGQYKFDPVQSVVTHFVKSSLDPTETGIVYHRKVKLDGDIVTLTTMEPNDASGSHNVLNWRRL